MKNDGFDEASQHLNDMANRAKELEGNQSVPLDELMADSFIQEHTDYLNFDSWFQAGGFSAESNEEFNAIDESDLDQYVSTSTSFEDWQDMLRAAAGAWGLNRILGS
ncbi:hypothetical protein SIL77_13330 [Exiguobacterium profundum]|uniref:hypothetical protein n=1 Tax=Exiguobacterium profundum TaxID=307643 RepID=UPI0011C906B5|nr:hypothetical protein [Exiguobacterium profundum]MDX5982240.1 hypothetical protein [Exiguobacterium profundum]